MSNSRATESDKPGFVSLRAVTVAEGSPVPDVGWNRAESLVTGGQNMVRNAWSHALLLGVVLTVAEGLAVAQEKVRDDVTSQISTLSLGQLILRDTFNDNKIASMWRFWSDDPNNCNVVEANARLEVRATSAAVDAFSGYVARAWRLDPHDDFSLKVNFHHDLVAYPRSWVSLGVSPDSQNPRGRRLNIDAQCVDRLKSFRYESSTDGFTDSSVAERSTDNGTLYVSYTAADDTLYLSMSGYGMEHAWGAFQGVVQEQWGGRPLFVWAGGGSNGMDIGAGRVYLDDLEVETGTVIEASLHAVYHFKGVADQHHFYTMSESEKEELLRNTGAWTYMGVAFYAFPEDSDPDCKPVYRFWSTRTGDHFYTMSQDEKNRLMNIWGWRYEGIAFYAYPANARPEWALPVYRFWASSLGTHLYTIDEAEKKNLISKSSDVWTFENIAWYGVK